MKIIKFFILINVFFACQNENQIKDDLSYDKNGYQIIKFNEDYNNEFIFVLKKDTICLSDTAKIYFYPNKENLTFIKMYDYQDFKVIDSVLVDTFHQKILDTKESHVFRRDTLISTLYSGKNQESKNYLYKGPIFCFLIKDKNNGGYHLIKKEFKTVIVNCDSLEKMKYYTPNVN